MATSSSSSWIDLLSSNGSLVVRDNTPAKDKCQLSSLLRDKRRLTEDAVQVRINSCCKSLTLYGIYIYRVENE